MMNQLEYFVAVAEELNFTRAAYRLNISQPPLSRHIRILEESLGVILFNRSNKGVELTDAGKVLLEKAYKILSLTEKATQDTINAHKGEYGQLSIGLTGSITFFIIPFLKQFKLKYPSIRIRLIELNTPQQLLAFEDGRISIGFLCPPIFKDDLSISVVNKQKFVLALPINHPLANTTNPIHLKELVKDVFILVPQDSGFAYSDSIKKIFRSNHFSPKDYLLANVSTSVISLVAEELGIAVVPISLTNLNNDRVVFKEIANCNEYLEIALVRKNSEKSHVTETFISFIEELPEFTELS
ncbi:LysR family transcriptional regulator [Virgibacillus oceani]